MNKFKIKELLADHQELHSDFQIDNFIIGSQGDNWAQYKQCLREIKARAESIESDKIQLKILESKRESQKPFWLRMARRQILRRHKIEIADGLVALKNTIKERERELSRFLLLAGDLKSGFGTLTMEKRMRLEAKSWYNKARRMAAIDLMAYGRISTQTLEFVLSLPRPDATKLLSEFKLQMPPMLLG